MADCTFPRTARLLNASQFGSVFKKPIKSIDSSFIVLSTKHDAGCSRLGLAIAKKHLKKAVDRNLVKRLVRESFRQHKSELEGMDLVVMVQRNIELNDRLQLTKSLLNHWQRIVKRAG